MPGEVSMNRPQAARVKCYVDGTEQPLWYKADPEAGFCLRFVSPDKKQLVHLGRGYATETVFGEVKLQLVH
jgi:hypothetical protein